MEPNQTQNQNQNPAPASQIPPMSQTSQTPQNQSSIGGIIGTIIIIAIIILGGLYFWGKRIEENKLKQSLVSDTTSQETVTSEAAVIKSVSSSDDLNSIETDLNNTNLDNLGAEMNVEAQ